MPLIYDPVLDQWIESDTGETTQRQGERATPPDREPPPQDQEPSEPPTTDSVPDDNRPHDIDYWDANNRQWYKTEMTLKDTKQNIGGKEVNIPGVKTANETTQMLYRIDGKILEKPEKLRPHEGYETSDYEDNLPATLPPGYKKKEKKEEKDAPESKSTGAATIKVGVDTGKPDVIPLTDDLKALRDSKDSEDRRLYRILIDKGIMEFNFAVAEFNAQQGNISLRQVRVEKAIEKYKSADGYLLGQALADGVSTKTLKDAGFSQADIDESRKGVAYIKATPKEKFEMLQKSGDIPKNAIFDKMNPDGSVSYKLESLNNVHLIKEAKGKGVGAAIKEVYRFLTPWDEEGGQTYIDYIKKYPERVKETYLVALKPKKEETQEVLKAKYEAGQALPLWQKLLGAAPNIIYDEKNNKYIPFMIGEAPAVGSKSASLASRVGAQTQRVAQQVGTTRPVKTISPKDIGMTEAEFVKYREAARAIPDLSPEAWKDTQKINTKVDWSKVNDALKKGKEIQKQDEQSEVFNQYLKELKELLEQTADYKPPVKGLGADTDVSAVRGGTAAAYKRWLAANPFGAKKPEAPTSSEIKSAVSNKAATYTPNEIQAKSLAASVIATSLSNITPPDIDSKVKPFNNTDFENEIDRQLLTIPNTDLRTDVRNEIENLTKTKTETKTATQTATQTQTKTQVKTETKPQTSTQTKTDTATKTDTQTKTQTQTGTQTKTGTGTQTGTGGGTYQPKPRDDKEKKKKKYKIPRLGKEDKEARKKIATARGAIAWRQGELNGKDRWDVITNIYRPGQEEYGIVLGKTPQGATIVKGPGSARRTAQYLYGKQPLKQTSVIDQPGLFTTRLDPITGRKVQLSFVRDADISGKSPSISQKGSIFPLAGQNARKTV